ncbi:MAG: ADP-ribosylglycohydrolase family protein [Prevotella sp.]|jgi:ADP-ribosylglycohydrolase|nr:ADP-ribosylglycohydrolase family protein [Prevotella sp.]
MTKKLNIEYAKKSLLGLSIGDAFGDSFFGDLDTVNNYIDNRIVPPYTKWEYTDDTVMAIAVLNNLVANGEVNQDMLAKQFASNYRKDINRGYGGTAHKILREIGEGQPWQEVSASVFDGQGSMGNGAAMRTAPLGAYFYNDLKWLKSEVAKSALVTHFNLEARVGATAIAYAASLALNLRLTNTQLSAEAFIKEVYDQLEDSDTKSKIRKAMHIPGTYRIDTVVSILGNGIKLTSQDTVPIAIWCAANHLDNFEDALWRAVSALGDRDTICAMVGSIVILYAPDETIPQEWLNSVESTDTFYFD